MATDAFVAELGHLPIEEWLSLCIRRYGLEKLAGGAREALKLVTDIYLQAMREEGQDIKLPRLLHIDDFLRDTKPPPPSIAEGILPANKLVVLGGAPKEGKGLVVLEILHALAEGSPVMDRFEVQPLSEAECVVYFGMEDGAAEIKTRLEKRGAANLPFYICSDAINMATPEGFALFNQMVRELPHKAVLVVIDTLRKAYPTIRDYNDAAQVAPHISALCDWAHDNCTVILVHHTNKNPLAVGVNRLSGSNAVASSADGYMVLFDKNDSEKGILRWKLEASGRGEIGGNFRLEGDMETYKIRVLETDEEAKAERADRDMANQVLCEQILRYAMNNNGITAQAASDILQIKKDAAQRRIYELVQADALKKGQDKVTLPSGQKAVTYLPTPHSERFFFTDRGGTSPKKNLSDDEEPPAFLRDFLADAEEV
jgi:hypothetical protein